MATNLETKLFTIADELRSSMDANEYKNYILGFIFYRYLSEKQENYLNWLCKTTKAYAKRSQQTLIIF